MCAPSCIDPIWLKPEHKLTASHNLAEDTEILIILTVRKPSSLLLHVGRGMISITSLRLLCLVFFFVAIVVDVSAVSRKVLKGSKKVCRRCPSETPICQHVPTHVSVPSRSLVVKFRFSEYLGRTETFEANFEI